MLHWAEDAINIGIAVLLVAGGVVLLVEAARIGITGLSDDVVGAMTQMLDTILLVFIFAELLYAVRTVIIERTIIAEPFLLVGIIASIKEILFLSLKAAELLDKGPEFARALAQIGVLGGLHRAGGGGLDPPPQGARAGRVTIQDGLGATCA